MPNTFTDGIECTTCHYAERSEKIEPCAGCSGFSRHMPMTEHRATQIAKQVQDDKNEKRKAGRRTENFNLSVLAVFLIAFVWFVVEVAWGGR